AAGFAESAQAPAHSSLAVKNHVALVATAREQAETLSRLCQEPGTLFSAEDVFSLLSLRLKRLVPHDSMAVYMPQGDDVALELVAGENYRLFASLKIPLGEGLSGWVSQNHKPILNGNPSVEPGYLNDPTKYSTLRSALAVPLETGSGAAAVLALYRAGQD